jgi:hypothetical protein
MATGVTDFGVNTWLNILFGITAPPSTYYVALCTEAPDDGFDGSILATIEPDPAFAYARQPIPADAADWATAISGFTTNAAEVDFGVPTDTWGIMTHFALCTAASAGDVYCYGELVNPSPVDITSNFSLPPGSIVLNLVSYQPPVLAS